MAVSPPAPAPADGPPDRRVPITRAPPDGSSSRIAGALLIALAAAGAYAAFARGAIDVSQEWRLQVAIAVIALVAATVALTDARQRFMLPTGRLALTALALFGAFAAWTAVSMIYSVAPDLSWASLNRAIGYVLAVAVALAAGASVPRAAQRFAAALLVAVLAVAIFALGGKMAPGLHVSGLFDLDHTAVFSRLRAPLGYWNALALVCVLGTAPALRVATDDSRHDAVRLAGLAALWVLVLAVGLTYSRGGVLALVVVLITLTVLGGSRLRGLAAFVLAAAATAPVLAVAFSREALNGNGVPLGARIHDGRILGFAALLCLLGLLGVGWLALRGEERIGWDARRSRRTWRTLGVTAGVLAVVGVLALAISSRGLTGSVSHAADSFTTAKSAPSTQDPSRLLSSNSSNRWVWWREAAGGFSDKPIAGWGAGSFPVVHLQYRQQLIPVRQPHSVPMQFLVETGLIGALLGLGAIGCLLVAAWRRVLALGRSRERDFAAALVACGTAWVVHSFYDWDWDIPAVTLPALVCLAVAAALPPSDDAGVRDALRGRGRRSPGARALTLGLVSLALSAYAVSALLPAWSDAKTGDALAAASDNASKTQLRDAAAQAGLAARLDPLAVAPLYAGAAIAERRGRLLESRRLLLRAAERQPQSETAWIRLAAIALRLADRPGLVETAQRAAQLDPLNPAALALQSAAIAFRTPPNASPTATGTPLPAAPVAPVPLPAPSG